MVDHVYARVSGFGCTLVPVAPYGWQQIPGRTSSVLAVHQAASGPKQATVVIEGGKATVKLGTGTSAASDVLDILPGPAHDHFVIETSVFTCRWPMSFALVSAPPDAPSKFDLCGADGALVYVQGPFPREKVPALKDMASPGQAIREQGCRVRGAFSAGRASQGVCLAGLFAG